MTAGSCCTGEGRRWRRLAAVLAPGALLVLLPKCPLCLAAWLTLATGVTVSSTAAGHLRGAILLVALLVVTALLSRSRSLWRASTGRPGRR